MAYEEVLDALAEIVGRENVLSEPEDRKVYAYDATSKKIADRKIESIVATGADLVVTACPGCIIQIADGLARGKKPVRVVHIAELFEARTTDAYREGEIGLPTPRDP